MEESTTEDERGSEKCMFSEPTDILHHVLESILIARLFALTYFDMAQGYIIIDLPLTHLTLAATLSKQSQKQRSDGFGICRGI